LQYDNENVTVHATNLHQKSHLDLSSLNSTHEELLTQPNPRKSCNFQTQPMDGPDPSSSLCSPLQGQLNGVFCGKSATSGHHAVSRVGPTRSPASSCRRNSESVSDQHCHCSGNTNRGISRCSSWTVAKCRRRRTVE